MMLEPKANPVPRPPTQTRREQSAYAKACRIIEQNARREKADFEALEKESQAMAYRASQLAPLQLTEATRPAASKQRPAPHKARVGRGRSQGGLRRNVRQAKTTSVGHYVVGESIGEGTFGKVKRGTHTLTGETVAIKILEKSKIKTEADLTRVTREIKILKKTRNEHTIRLLEVIDTPQQIFLMMEFLDGGEVFDYIVKKGRLPEAEASGFFKQILDGVDYLHAVNVIHRDLKPENLLMQKRQNGSFVVKVADFGLSNTNDNARLLQTACGSPCYAAPEMIAGKAYDGVKSDIWSLGVVLFAMVCGFLPFEDNDTSALYRKILAADYACPNFVSPEVQELLGKILDTNPDTRISMDMIRAHVWMRRHNSLKDQNQSLASIFADTSRRAGDEPSTNAEEADPVEDASGVAQPNERVVLELQQLGLDRDFVLKSLAQGLHNSATASYFLVAERHRREVCEDTSSRLSVSSSCDSWREESLVDRDSAQGMPIISTESAGASTPVVDEPAPTTSGPGLQEQGGVGEGEGEQQEEEEEEQDEEEAKEEDTVQGEGGTASSFSGMPSAPLDGRNAPANRVRPAPVRKPRKPVSGRAYNPAPKPGATAIVASPASAGKPDKPLPTPASSKAEAPRLAVAALQPEKPAAEQQVRRAARAVRPGAHPATKASPAGASKATSAVTSMVAPKTGRPRFASLPLPQRIRGSIAGRSAAPKPITMTAQPSQPQQPGTAKLLPLT